ncbi:hypothetical protein [Sphaerisporangium sp. TRM90804]|uniref:hypothetical protein n=1 Tax=Sphaerisporangium sp. TRM90804 TaxID=3031113 RepID=UPI00244AF99C|nr:hypothetical protein [Sphaerisporangium sp. TRM90804]MDH2429296.1 hypothetical protein [Sphaerisporangium sp. TRM90804]
MTRVHVITDAPRPGPRPVRAFLLAVLAAVVVVLTYVGHVAALVLGAVDAVIAARLGVPRLARCYRLVSVAVRKTWEEDQ